MAKCLLLGFGFHLSMQTGPSAIADSRLTYNATLQQMARWFDSMRAEPAAPHASQTTQLPEDWYILTHLSAMSKTSVFALLKKDGLNPVTWTRSILHFCSIVLSAYPCCKRIITLRHIPNCILTCSRQTSSFFLNKKIAWPKWSQKCQTCSKSVFLL